MRPMNLILHSPAFELTLSEDAYLLINCKFLCYILF